MTRPFEPLLVRINLPKSWGLGVHEKRDGEQETPTDEEKTVARVLQLTIEAPLFSLEKPTQRVNTKKPVKHHWLTKEDRRYRILAISDRYSETTYVSNTGLSRHTSTTTRNTTPGIFVVLGILKVESGWDDTRFVVVSEEDTGRGTGEGPYTSMGIIIYKWKIEPPTGPSWVTTLVEPEDVNVTVTVGLLSETTALCVSEEVNEKCGLPTEVGHTLWEEIDTYRFEIKEIVVVISPKGQDVSSLGVQLRGIDVGLFVPPFSK